MFYRFWKFIKFFIEAISSWEEQLEGIMNPYSNEGSEGKIPLPHRIEHLFQIIFASLKNENAGVLTFVLEIINRWTSSQLKLANDNTRDSQVILTFPDAVLCYRFSYTKSNLPSILLALYSFQVINLVFRYRQKRSD